MSAKLLSLSPGESILQGARHVFLVTLRLLNYSKRNETISEIDIFYDSEEVKKLVEHNLKKYKGRERVSS